MNSITTILSTLRLRSLLIVTPILFFQVTIYGFELDKSYYYVKTIDTEDWGDKKAFVHWRMSASASQYERETDSSAIFNTNLSGVLQYKFYPELKFYGRFDTVFQTGFAQSRYGDLSPSTGVYIYDAYFTVTPFKNHKNFYFEVGALNQSRTIRNSVLISRTSFPGISEVYDFDLGDKWSLSLRAQQLVPYSQTQNVQFTEQQETPYFLTEGLTVKYEAKNYQVRLMAGHYNYSELPNVVAEASRILGNSVTGFVNNAVFDYDFNGWYANLSYDSNIGSNLLLQADVNLVENTKADETYNRGEEYSVSLNYLNKDLQFGPYYSLFSLEPDVSPAFYNSSSFGNNNRMGWKLGFDLFIKKKDKTKLSIEYIQSNLLNDDLNPQQEDQNRWVLQFQTNFKQLGAW